MSNINMNEQEIDILRKRLKARRLFLGYTYQELADKTGLSKSTLQRYETGGIKSLSYDKIYILSSALEVTTDYFTDLTKDYTGDEIIKPTTEFKQDRSDLIKRMRDFEEDAIKKITPILISNGYNVEKHSTGSLGDIVATKGKEIWHIDFSYNSDVNKYPVGMGMGRQQLLLRFGRLATFDKPITKYSILFERRLIAEQYLTIKPVHLDIDISLLYLRNDGYEELFFSK